MTKVGMVVGVGTFALLAACTNDYRTFWDTGKANIDSATKIPAATGAAAFDVPSLIVAGINVTDANDKYILNPSSQLSNTASPIYAATIGNTQTQSLKGEAREAAIQGYRLSTAFKVFDSYYLSQSKWQDAQLRRRQIQDSIVAESNTLCGEYEQTLNRFNQEGNFLFGSASTLLGGLGAIFTQASAARPLAGAASIFSGVRGELNADVFQQQAIQVITNGIDSRRKRIAQIMACHVNDSLLNYTLERAVAQAFKYHEACSLISGLEEANKATSQGSDVGLAAAHQTMHAIELMYQDLHPNSAQIFSTASLSSSSAISSSSIIAVSQPISSSAESTCNTLLALEDSADNRGTEKTGVAGSSLLSSSSLSTPAVLGQQEYNDAKAAVDVFNTAISTALSNAKPMSDKGQLSTDAQNSIKDLNGSLKPEIAKILDKFNDYVAKYIEASTGLTTEILEDQYRMGTAGTADDKARYQVALNLAVARAASSAQSAFALVSPDAGASDSAGSMTLANYLASKQKTFFAAGLPEHSDVTALVAKLKAVAFSPLVFNQDGRGIERIVNESPQPIGPPPTLSDVDGRLLNSPLKVSIGMSFTIVIHNGMQPYDAIFTGPNSPLLARDGSSADIDQEKAPNNVIVTIGQHAKPGSKYLLRVVDSSNPHFLKSLFVVAKATDEPGISFVGHDGQMVANPTTITAENPLEVTINGGNAPYQVKLTTSDGTSSANDIAKVTPDPKGVANKYEISVGKEKAKQGTKYVLQVSDASKPALTKSLNLIVGAAAQP